ncbi:MAG TPA: serine hydrolase domain-containing protein, partial [Steroidobacteraceae bacterium]
AGALASPSGSAQMAGKIHRLDGSLLRPQEADGFANKTLQDMHVTGAQIAVINDGRIFWTSAYGHRRKDPELPMTVATNIWAASLTKAVFATYVMQLVERKEFDLDEPVASQLEKPLNEYEPYKESAAALVHDPDWPLVTPRMLLSHSSGLQNFAWIEPDKQMHLHFKPGTRFLYSGEGINLVQLVIEQKMHKGIDLLLQDSIFGPCGMTRTGMVYRDSFAADVADRYDQNEHFLSATQRFPAHAAGSMATTISDFAKFLVALLDDKIISSSTRAQMLHPAIRISTKFQFGSDVNETDGKEAKAVGLAYGMGWGLLTHTRSGPAIFKEGHGDGAQNYAICFLQQRSCMVLLTNSDNGELAFRPLLEHILGDTVTPWEWEGYAPASN